MNIDRKTLNATAAAFRALDLEAENEQLAALAVEQVRLEKAHAAASERIQEIGHTLRQMDGPYGAVDRLSAGNARAVADALLAGADPTEAASSGPSRAELERQRDALNAGRRELHQQIEDNRRAIEEVRRTAKRHAAELARPLAEALLADAQEAATKLTDAYLSLRALSAAVGGGAAGDAERRAHGAVQAAFAEPQLLPFRSEMQVAPEVLDVIRALDGKGPALKFYAPRASVDMTEEMRPLLDLSKVAIAEAVRARAAG